MKRLVRSHTLLSEVVGWFFVAALFCDQANLDDLLSRSVVLHDDDKVYATDLGACEGTNSPKCWEQQRSVGASAVRQSAPLSRTIVRVIIDQDSPSTPAGQIHILVKPLPSLENSPAVSFDNELPTELLYLQFHSLLI
jgi:hypothetical protein